MIVLGILALSILLQFFAAVLALKLMRMTGRRLAWVLLSAAILLMAGRRCITFVEIVQDPTFVHRAHLLPEFFALLTSVLMVGGMATIGSVFKEQQRDKKEAQESEMRFRQLAENIREVFWLMDWPDRTIVYVSPAYEAIWGRSARNLQADPLYRAEGVHPEDYQRLEPLSRELLEQGIWDIEYRVVRPDGAFRWVHDRAFPIREKSGRIHRIAGIAEDITGRKQIEEDLRRRHMEQKAFSRIILATTTYLDLHIILQGALEGALELTGLEGGTICMVDHKLGILNLAAHINVSETVVHDLTTREIKIGECLCGNVAKTGEPLILWDNASGSEFATRETARNEGIRFHAAFPLVTKGEIIGVLCIFARSTITPSQRSLDLVRDLCGPIGCAIENASLYEAECTSREHFTRIIESITDGFVAIDRKGCFTYVNQRAAEMMGLPLEELIGKPCWPEFPVPLCHSLYGPCEKALAEQEPRHLEEYLTEKQRWLDIRIYPSRDGLAVYFQDITDLKQSLEELRKSHEHLEATFNALPDFLFELDGEGRILDYRAPAMELLYVPPEEFLGKTFLEVLPEEASGVVAAAIEEARTRGSHRGAVCCLKTKAGLAWFELSIAVKGNLEGPEMRFIVLVRDITARKLAEERLNASLKEKEVLIREVHHRVKNNMQVISSLLRLQSRYVKDEKILEVLRESHNRIKAMTMVHELLYRSEDMARINLRDYFKAMAHNLYRAYGVDPRKINLNIEVADIFLRVDLAIPCGLVINELLSNSLKHAFPGDRCGHINLTAHHVNGNEIEIVVYDNGMGLSEEMDLHETDSLGLRIVVLLIQEQMKGHITLHKVEGTKFTIHIPIGETQ